MRSELVSAELYENPAIITADSKRVLVRCGEHMLCYNLRSGKLLGSSGAVLAKPDNIVLKGEELIASNRTGFEKFTLSRESVVSGSPTRGNMSVLSTNGLLSVVSVPSDGDLEKRESSLGYIIGDINCGAEMQTVLTARVSRVAQSAHVFAAIIGTKNLYVYDTRTKSGRTFKHSETLTSVAVHPNGRFIAAGDLQGRIMRFDMSLGPECTGYTSMQHWHSVPVASLVFAGNGSMLLSGAEEGVLCIWNDAKSAADGKPQFVPRLGGAIAHISVSGCGQFAAVSVKTNSVAIVDLFTKTVPKIITGTVHDGERGITRMTRVVGTTKNLVAYYTKSHVQIFDVDSRTPVTTAWVQIQERNYLPSTIRNKVKADPWECSAVAVLAGETTWYMMASLERKSLSSTCMMKIFESKDCGETWNLQNVCVNAHASRISALHAIPATQAFVSGSHCGEMKIWKLNQGDSPSAKSFWQIVKATSFRQKSLAHISVSPTGLICAAYEKYITVWHPDTLVELSKGVLVADLPVVSAFVLEDTLEVFALLGNGSVDVWDLKKLTKAYSTQTGSVITGTSAILSPNGSLIFGAADELIECSNNDVIRTPFDGHVCDIVLTSQGSIIVSAGINGQSIHKLSEETDAHVPFREPEEDTVMMEDDQVAEDTSETEVMDHGPSSRRLPRMNANSIVGKLFPIENPLDELPSPEASFNLLIASLVPRIVV